MLSERNLPLPNIIRTRTRTRRHTCTHARAILPVLHVLRIKQPSTPAHCLSLSLPYTHTVGFSYMYPSISMHDTTTGRQAGKRPPASPKTNTTPGNPARFRPQTLPHTGLYPSSPPPPRPPTQPQHRQGRQRWRVCCCCRRSRHRASEERRRRSCRRLYAYTYTYIRGKSSDVVQHYTASYRHPQTKTHRRRFSRWLWKAAVVAALLSSPPPPPCAAAAAAVSSPRSESAETLNCSRRWPVASP